MLYQAFRYQRFSRCSGEEDTYIISMSIFKMKKSLKIIELLIPIAKMRRERMV